MSPTPLALLFCTTCLTLSIDVSAQEGAYLERAQSELRGSIFGLGPGIATAIAATLKPSTVEQMSDNAGNFVERTEPIEKMDLR